MDKVKTNAIIANLWAEAFNSELYRTAEMFIKDELRPRYHRLNDLEKSFSSMGFVTDARPTLSFNNVDALLGDIHGIRSIAETLNDRGAEMVQEAVNLIRAKWAIVNGLSKISNEDLPLIKANVEVMKRQSLQTMENVDNNGLYKFHFDIVKFCSEIDLVTKKIDAFTSEIAKTLSYQQDAHYILFGIPEEISSKLLRTLAPLLEDMVIHKDPMQRLTGFLSLVSPVFIMANSVIMSDNVSATEAYFTYLFNLLLLALELSIEEKLSESHNNLVMEFIDAFMVIFNLGT